MFVLLAYNGATFFPVGTAFIIESRSQTILLTAYHCLILSAHHFAVVRTVTRNEDGSGYSDPPVPIRVDVLGGDQVADVAVLRADHTLGTPIPLCPADQEPVQLNEDIVKSYHCPVQLFTDQQIETLGVMVTEYVKISIVSRHHIFVPSEHMRGSSGGVIVDEQGRAVGLICSGIVPGMPLLAIENPFNTVWESVTALSNGAGAFVKATKLSAVNGLAQYLANN